MPSRRFTYRQRKGFLLVKYYARSKPKLTIVEIFTISGKIF